MAVNVPTEYLRYLNVEVLCCDEYVFGLIKDIICTKCQEIPHGGMQLHNDLQLTEWFRRW
jgi:hypothetical protein